MKTSVELTSPGKIVSPLKRGSDDASAQAPNDVDLIELLFFAYRDFVGEPDRLLARHGFGRAHHRVLHFVNRRQGLNVAELLEILEITKQSLARVLKDLINAGFVQQQAGAEDRRQRLLFLTGRGKELADALVGMQSARMERALAAAGAQHRPVIARFLAELIDKERTGINPEATE
ncbi:MAG: MarR family transcriptional [Beijerinckiaceae bacterium]|nr:MAG: MarR family transcriptional [Beijerinckiaceae bacterium]